MGSGRTWASNMTIVLRAGPGLDILFAGRAGPGPGLIIQFAGRAGPGPHNSVCGPGRVCTTAAGPGLGLKSYLRAGPGPKFQTRAGP